MLFRDDRDCVFTCIMTSICRHAYFARFCRVRLMVLVLPGRPRSLARGCPGLGRSWGVRQSLVLLGRDPAVAGRVSCSKRIAALSRLTARPRNLMRRLKPRPTNCSSSGALSFRTSAFFFRWVGLSAKDFKVLSLGHADHGTLHHKTPAGIRCFGPLLNLDATPGDFFHLRQVGERDTCRPISATIIGSRSAAPWF